MKKFLSFFVGLTILVAGLPSFAEPLKAVENISFSAEKVTSCSKVGISGRLCKKYKLIKLTVSNNSNQAIKLADHIYFSNDNEESILVPSKNIVYETAKADTMRRSLIWGVPVGLTTAFLLTPVVMGVSIASSTSINSKLKDNIDTIAATPGYVFKGERYTGIVFLSKKIKNVRYVVIQNVEQNQDVYIDLKSEITDVSL